MVVATQQTGDRVNLTYQSKTGDRVEDVELPFRVMVLADLTGDERSEFFQNQTPIRLDKADISILFQQLKPELHFKVADRLSEDGGEILVKFSFRSLLDFTPQKVIESVPALSALLSFNESLSRLADGAALQVDEYFDIFSRCRVTR